jgi:hypothetical protein
VKINRQLNNLLIANVNPTGDVVDDSERTNNIAIMSKKFGSYIDVKNDWLNEDGTTCSIDMNIATGFPPGASDADVKNDKQLLTRATLAQCKQPRIKITKKSF